LVYTDAYLALAEETGLELGTTDQKMHRMAIQLGLKVVRGL